MSSDFDRLIDRRGTNCLKWDGCRRVFGRDDLLPMWVADMDFAAPPAVMDAIKDRADHGVFGYIQGPEPAFAALTSWLEERHGWRILTDWCVVTPGVVSALSLVVLALTEPGDEIVIQPPVYPPFFSVVRNQSGSCSRTRCVRGMDGTSWISDNLEILLNRHDRVRMLILCSPHNPVGRVWERAELTRLGELCLSHNVLVVSDEIHADIVFDGLRHVCTASISEELQSRTITLTAPSKTFNLAGLATSAVIISHPELRREFQELQRRLRFSAENIFGLAAMEAVYRHGEDWLRELLGYLEGNRDFLLAFLAERTPGIKAVRPEGTYLAWLDCRGLGMDGDRLRRFLIDEAKVGLNDGRDFGPMGEGFARLNFGCPRALLQEGLERLAAAAGRLG